MRPDSDLGVVLRTRAGRKTLFVLFLLSILLDFDMLLMPILIHWGFVHPARLAHLPLFLASTVEAGVMVAATIFWLLMLCACTFDPVRPMAVKLIWALVFLFTTWLRAQFFYLISFGRSIKRLEQPG
jgi:hypothetical protein